MQAVRTSLRRCFSQWDAVQSCCGNVAVRHLSAEAMPAPTPDNAHKTYPLKIEKIVNEIAGLTLIEVADLSELLKKRLNLPDAPVMPMGGFVPAAAAAAAAPAEEAEEAVKNSFNVKIVKFDEKQKVPLIKCVKGLMEGMNLVQAKKLIESAPVLLKENVEKEEAEKIKKELLALGAEVTLE
ncbi:39S ribosomal protein L12, mitochondrial [Thrips palmi]|uniref:Large ribosomal subunit protein bL12m n=1 Tax=Thrips palmi TaxID=161013 RepID=A0A6P8Z190_THRPL|nr:39S ribosomal protein L12, mitochondrial [Thrips palmi]